MLDAVRIPSRIWNPSASGSTTSSSTRSGSGVRRSCSRISRRFIAPLISNPSSFQDMPHQLQEQGLVFITRMECLTVSVVGVFMPGRRTMLTQ